MGAGGRDRGRDRLPATAHRAPGSAPDALDQISFRLVADDDQFMTIAKVRAARELWARVGDALGHPGHGAARIHAVTSLPMMTQRDPG